MRVTTVTSRGTKVPYCVRGPLALNAVALLSHRAFETRKIAQERFYPDSLRLALSVFLPLSDGLCSDAVQRGALNVYCK
jgi:hypothetical protein